LWCAERHRTIAPHRRPDRHPRVTAALSSVLIIVTLLNAWTIILLVSAAVSTVLTTHSIRSALLLNRD
jgi:hypothetical protein